MRCVLTYICIILCGYSLGSWGCCKKSDVFKTVQDKPAGSRPRVEGPPMPQSSFDLVLSENMKLAKRDFITCINEYNLDQAANKLQHDATLLDQVIDSKGKDNKESLLLCIIEKFTKNNKDKKKENKESDALVYLVQEISKKQPEQITHEPIPQSFALAVALSQEYKECIRSMLTYCQDRAVWNQRININLNKQKKWTSKDYDKEYTIPLLHYILLLSSPDVIEWAVDRLEKENAINLNTVVQVPKFELNKETKEPHKSFWVTPLDILHFRIQNLKEHKKKVSKKQVLVDQNLPDRACLTRQLARLEKKGAKYQYVKTSKK